MGNYSKCCLIKKLNGVLIVIRKALQFKQTFYFGVFKYPIHISNPKVSIPNWARCIGGVYGISVKAKIRTALNFIV